MSSVLQPPDINLVETDFHGFNLALWEQLQNDSTVASIGYRIETDQHGQIIMSPPPAPEHGDKQLDIGYEIKKRMTEGKALTECPVSTSKGVKAADVAWCTKERWEGRGEAKCFVVSPEICVEVISPSNTKSEIDEKIELYFEVGAEEVWICREDGKMTFFIGDPQSPGTSKFFPDFPTTF